MFPVTGALGSSAPYTSFTGMDDKTCDMLSAVSIYLWAEVVSWEHGLCGSSPCDFRDALDQ